MDVNSKKVGADSLGCVLTQKMDGFEKQGCNYLVKKKTSAYNNKENENTHQVNVRHDDFRPFTSEDLNGSASKKKARFESKNKKCERLFHLTPLHGMYNNKENEITPEVNVRHDDLRRFTSEDLNGTVSQKKALFDSKKKKCDILLNLTPGCHQSQSQSHNIGRIALTTESKLGPKKFDLTNTCAEDKSTHIRKKHEFESGYRNFIKFSAEHLHENPRNDFGNVKGTMRTPKQTTGIHVGCPILQSVKSKRVSKLKPSNKELSRKLFEPVRREGYDRNSVNWEEIEKSVIQGIDDNDDDFLAGDYCDDSIDEELDVVDHNLESKLQSEYCTLGGPSEKCQHCHAIMWKEERVNKCVKRGIPKFSICCRKGQIVLPKNPAIPSYLWQLFTDPKKRKHFQNCARIYNSMFAFTSTGGTVDHSINNGGGPYVYRLNGQNHHVFGSLIPDDGQPPKFCQLYIYDTDNEVSNRMQWVDVEEGRNINPEIVEGLIKMFDENNELVKEFRVARDRFKDSPVVDLKITLKVCRSESGRENNIGPSDEVAGIMVGDLEETEEGRDIIIEKKMGGLQRVTTIHPKLMALQYPILFPNGEDGYHKGIAYVDTEENVGKTRRECSMMDFYSYRLQVRHNQGMICRMGGRLFQQYLVDSFSCIEQARLWWYRIHQTTLRSELYNHICDHLKKGDGNAGDVGKSFILPAGFVGSRRYMQQNFQDALAVCRYIGHPDIFLTMTSNPIWDEIIQMLKLIPNAIPQDNPDIAARVFHLKLEQLLEEIKKKETFGKCVGVMYVVEFQKRGLPHVHMLIWLDEQSKKNLRKNVDKYVSAEIPDPVKDPVGYCAVKSFMMHGPCGAENYKSPCMKDSKCTRHFPKKFSAHTMFDDSGFPLYKRRNTNVTVKVRNSELDNRYVVPYNRDLLVKFQCHMNIEICSHARSLKYLFKYCLKGHDRATVEIRGKKCNRTVSAENSVDEIQAFFDGRYICGAEAAYRIFGYDIHHRSISVERLSYHLPGKKNCTFRSTDKLEKVIQREKNKKSKLEAYFHLNRIDIDARKYTYDEIPKHYVWNSTGCFWSLRKRGLHIGRLTYTHHSSGELWYLRMLLHKVHGPTSFKKVRTVNDVEYATFQEACDAYGLLDDDKEWHEVLKECSKCGFPPQIRELFVRIIVNCRVSDLTKLWLNHWKEMSDDILYTRRKKTGNANLCLNEDTLQYLTIAEIDAFLRSIGKSLKDFPQLPRPPSNFMESGINNLIVEETAYDKALLAIEHNNLFSQCNEEQANVYHAVIESVQKNEGGLFFVYGSGGCGKTYLWRTIISKLRSEGKIVLPVASSGIAATLLHGGRTAHSRFKIPIVLDEFSHCSIGHNSDIAELIRSTSLIIWDEAPMQHRFAFECLDRSLRDIMKSVDVKLYHKPFGGITVLLGGDFRQILPVISHGKRSDIVSACITRSKLWRICKVFILEHNMRLQRGSTDAETADVKNFSNWVLQIGNGNLLSSHVDVSQLEGFDISIPDNFCNLEAENSVDNMVTAIFPDFQSNFNNAKYLSERAILTPTNETVSHLNSLIVEKVPGKSFSYLSVDTGEEFGGTDAELNLSFPTEYLNSLAISGLPAHNLQLKVGVVVMLMRNLNQTLGLCNGTRMIVTKCLKYSVECEVICGHYSGTRHFIPRIECSPSDSRLPFKLIRKQMPLQICYAMTINKSQGQSLEMVGLFLPKSVFTHGQLYVAISRVTSPKGLKVFIDDERGHTTCITQNVVFQEVFYNLPMTNIL